jgi:hypothetical protein
MPHVKEHVHKKAPWSDRQMDIEVRTLNAGVLSLKTSLIEAVAALDKDGILLLKEATDLSSVESALARDLRSFDGFRSDIVLHKAGL